ncbi:centromere protein F isoform X2 [Anguilla anguilla]|uniref:centromere protein F isoform X2 n=1 Tax=Anguilla anguilla TaxID=7936 RepID=UPI0015AACB2A|nr:centromere protein F isoform X2 [Anguilla anguilla]
MSWAVGDWAAGLSGTALQKVRELQAQQDRLQREKQQRQLQLESTEAALCKQKQKFEEVRVELAGVRKDLQSSQEEVLVGVRERQRLSQELQVKQAQVCGLEGQLDSARSVSHTLTQEVKRLEAELEKLQNANSSGDSALFSTPCWNVSSWEHSGSRREQKDSSGGGDGEVRAQHVRQLQFAEHSPTPASSPFPRQLQSTPPSGRRNRQPKPPSASAVFPWEREEASSAPRGRAAALTPPTGNVFERCSPEDAEKEADVRKENDIQRSKVVELQTWVQSLKQEVCSASDRHRESEAQLAEVQGELAAREQTLSRARQELDQANGRVEKEKDRAQAAEQRVKQLQEELGCQRQNAESSRRSAEQRRKDLEREHQRELLELQKESQSREKQHQQESNKLNQELQQARTLHNTLQAQCDKVLLQKQTLEKDLDGVKGKLQWTEKELQECQKREAQIQSKLMDALREKDSLGLSLEQSSQRVKSLEEEVKRLSRELAEALRLVSELQAQLAVPATPAVPARCLPVGDSFSCPVTPHRPSHVPKKKVARPEKSREEQQEQRAKYPTDREPAEGIDSDFIGEFGSQAPKGEGGKAGNEADRRGSITRQEEDEQRGKETTPLKRDKTSVDEEGASIKEQEDAGTDQGETLQRDVSVLTKDEKQEHHSCDGDTQPDGVGVLSQDSVSSSGVKGQHGSPSLQDLKRENAALRDDLREAKRELEQRLEDLEAQRRAETEARTKLKQVSRKHSSQVEQLRQKTQELKEEGGRLEKQVEEERKESGRLREALDALESERREEQVEKKREGKEERAEVDKLRANLAALETELRKQQEDGETESLKSEECRRALEEEVAELKTELEELRNSKLEGEKGSEEAKNPLLPLILDFNSNNNNSVTTGDDNLIPSPAGPIPLCDSVEEETLEKVEIDLICKEGAKASKPPGESRELYLAKPAVDGPGTQAKSEKLLDSDEVVQLVLEVERLRGDCVKLRGERDREAGRAKQAQARLEVLQSQVTNQTKQLTLAFENQSGNITDLLGELQDRDSTLQRLEEELRGCRGEIAELKAEKHKLQLGSEGFEEPEETGPVEMNSHTPSTPGQAVTPDSEAEQTADRSPLQDSGQTSLSMTPPMEQMLQSINNDGSVKDFQAELRDLKAENEELRSKLAAAATVKGLNCLDADLSALIGDGTTQRLVAELEAAKEDLSQVRAKNEELQSMLSQAQLSNKQEKQPLDSEVKQGLLCESQQNIIVSGDSGTHAEEAMGRVEAFVNQDFLTEQSENHELKLMVETTSFLEGSMQQTMSTGQKAGDAHKSNKDSESDTDVQHHQHHHAIIRLQAENQALRSWALAVCPPDRQGELAAIAESGFHSGTNCKLGDGDSKLTRAENLADEGSVGIERVVVSEQSSQSDVASQSLLKLPPAQELASPHSNDGLHLDGGKDPQDQIQSEPCGLKSGEMDDDTAQQQTVTGKTGMEQDQFSPSQLTALQKQLIELQSEVSSLREENTRQAEELEVWRVTGEPISPLLTGETAIHSRQGSIVVVREDQLVLTCNGDDLESTHTLRDVQVEYGGLDISEKNSAPAERVDRDNGQGSSNPTERTLESLRSTGNLPVTIQVPTIDTNVMTDFKTKAMIHRDMDKGTKIRPGSHDVSHPSSVTVESDDNSKVIQSCVAGKQTKATENTHRDDQEKGANHYDSKSKAADCRTTEDHIEAASREGSLAKTKCTNKAMDHKGTHAPAVENAGAVSEHIAPVKETQGVERPHQQILCSVNTKDCTTDSGKTHRDGNSLLEEKRKESQITKSIFITEDTQMYCVQTKTQTESKHGLKNDSPLFSEVDTTKGNTLTTTHRQSPDSTTDMPKLVCPGVEREKEPLPPQHSAPCGPKVVTRDCQTQTEVDSESLAFTEQRAGVDPEGSVSKELRSMATQTDGDSRGVEQATPGPPAGGGEIKHSSTQTEPAEIQDEDPNTSNEELEQNSYSPPLSPMLAPEGGTGPLFSGSFPIPADPARLAERIRRNRSRISAAFDDTEYEPYGLPEVVMKGFADIPSGPACPYVLRRGLLGTDALPLPLREQAEEEQD